MTEHITSAHIAASPEQVWSVLTNSAAYAVWNPEIVGIDGAIAPNARITAHVRLGSGVVRRVPQRVTALEAPRLPDLRLTILAAWRTSNLVTTHLTRPRVRHCGATARRFADGDTPARCPGTEKKWPRYGGAARVGHCRGR